MARLGLGAYIAFGYVAGYTTDGTNAALDFYLPVEGGFHNLQGETDRMNFENLDTYDPLRSMQFGGQKRVSGSVTFRAPWGAMADILRMITGHNATIAGAPLLGDFTALDPNATAHILWGTTKRNLFAEVYTGSTDGNSTFYQGLAITQATINFAAADYVEISLTFLGRGVTRGAKSAAPAFKRDLMKTPVGSAARLLSIGGTQYRSNSVGITIDTPYSHNYDVADDEPSTNPQPDGKRSVTVEVDIEAADTDATFQSLLETPETAGSEKDVVVTLNPSGNDLLTFTLKDCLLEPGVEARPEGVGLLRATMTFTAHDDGAVPIYDVSLQNNDYASATLP